jgi:hypothetical protein
VEKPTASLPVESASRAELLCAGAVFLVALFLYSWTLAPTVTLVDSGELIVAAQSLGVAHPPGFPLHVMLAHLASLVPIGNVAVRVNFASAIFAALGAAMLTLVVAEVLIVGSKLAALQRVRKKLGRKGKAQSPEAISRALSDDSVANSWHVFAPSVSAGLLFAFSRTLWSYATIAEVYALNALLILVVFFLMLRWRRRILEAQNSTGGKADRLLYVAAIVFGLALGVHHVTVALILPALAVLVYRTAGPKFFTSKRLLYAALFSIGALVAVYSYLPFAAAHRPIMNWGDPRSLHGIWAHITGKQYQLFLSFSPSIMGEQLPQFGKFLFREFSAPWLPLALIVAISGFIAAFKRDRTIFFVLLLVVAADLAYTLNYDISEDKDAYYLPVFIAIAVAAGFGFHSFLQFVLPKQSLKASGLFIVGLGLMIVPALALAGNWPFNNRSQYFVAQDYVENIQSTIEPNGLLLTLDWQVASPMLYTREVEQRRRDVKAVDIQLLRRSWYFDYLKRAYPGLTERSRDKIETYLADLKQWEDDRQSFTNSPALTQRIVSEFQEMVRSFVTKELQIAPVYVTAELVLMTEGEDKELIQWLATNYQPFPRGLVFQLANDSEFHDPGEVHLQMRGLTDGTIRFEADDVVNQKILPRYTTMLLNRGRYFAHYDRQERAMDAFRQALKLDPSYDLARKGLEESTVKLLNSKAPP